MTKKLAIRILALMLCFVSVFTAFAACSDNKDKNKDNTDVSNFTPDWAIRPEISAQAIQPLVRADFNENTSHYDISFAPYFRIMINGKYGIIDFNGEIVIPAEYDEIFAIRNSDDFLGVKIDGEDKKQTYIHSDTFDTQSARKKYNSKKYEYYWNVDNSSALFVVTEDGSTQKEDFSPSLPETVKGVKYISGKYNSTGKFGLYSNSRNVTGMVYSGAGVFTDGLAAFKSNGKWGYIDSNGRTVVPFEYDAVWGYSALGGEDTPYECSEGHITVCKDKKFGILKDDGSLIVDFIFDDATPVINGKAFVKQNGKYGVIKVYESADEPVSENKTEEQSSSTSEISTSTTTSTTSTTTTTSDETSSTDKSKTSTTTEKSTTTKKTTTTTEKSTTTTTKKTTTTTETTTKKQNYSTGTYTVKLSSGGSLNLRSEAGVGGTVVGSLKNGAVIYVDKVSNGWGHTVYNGKEGWFSLKYAEKN